MRIEGVLRDQRQCQYISLLHLRELFLPQLGLQLDWINVNVLCEVVEEKRTNNLVISKA